MEIINQLGEPGHLVTSPTQGAPRHSPRHIISAGRGRGEADGRHRGGRELVRGAEQQVPLGALEKTLGHWVDRVVFFF